MCHWCQLIIPDNFYFHHHGQSSIYNFSNTDFRTHVHTPENPYIEVGRAHLKGVHGLCRLLNLRRRRTLIVNKKKSLFWTKQVNPERVLFVAQKVQPVMEATKKKQKVGQSIITETYPYTEPSAVKIVKNPTCAARNRNI